MSTRLEDIYTHLKSQGLNVYLPGQHTGDCRSFMSQLSGGLGHRCFELEHVTFWSLFLVGRMRLVIPATKLL